MSWFSFPSTVRSWVAIWIVILFIGLMPLPPAAELIIVVAFVAHSAWFVQRRLRRAAMLRALARADRAEEAERDAEGTGCRLAAPPPLATEFAVFRVSPEGSLVRCPHRFLTGPHEVGVNLELSLPTRVRKLVHVSDLHPA